MCFLPNFQEVTYLPDRAGDAFLTESFSLLISTPANRHHLMLPTSSDTQPKSSFFLTASPTQVEIIHLFYNQNQINKNKQKKIFQASNLNGSQQNPKTTKPPTSLPCAAVMKDIREGNLFTRCREAALLPLLIINN